MALIEAVPNVSEGRRMDIISKLVDAVSQTPGSQLLDHSSDPDHNRTVLTLVGDAVGLREALLALYRVAIETIDVTAHRGVHPRIGAVDVVPFVPLREATLDDCISLARALGREVADQFRLPVFLYERAATRPERQALEDIRRGQLEGLTERMTHEEWQPDFGPTTPHPTAGATAIGARPPLIAFNIDLDTDDLDIAKQIARTVRARSGGLPHLKAIGVRLSRRDRVQVSMNVTDYAKTPLHRVFRLVEREAAKLGVSVAQSELVGLVPAEAMIATAAAALRLDGFRQDQVLETRLSEWTTVRHGPSSEER